ALGGDWTRTVKMVGGVGGVVAGVSDNLKNSTLYLSWSGMTGATGVDLDGYDRSLAFVAKGPSLGTCSAKTREDCPAMMGLPAVVLSMEAAYPWTPAMVLESGLPLVSDMPCEVPNSTTAVLASL